MKFIISRFSFNFTSSAYDLHDMKHTYLHACEVRVETKLKVIIHVLRRKTIFKTSYFLKFLLFNEGFGFSIELTIACFVNCPSLKTVGNYLVAMPIITSTDSN